MMVGTRSGVRPEAQPHLRGGELVLGQGTNPESSDDDNEEEIPNTSPPKSKTDPNIRALDPRRTRQLENVPLLQNRPFKRRRVGSAVNNKRAPAYLTSAPSSTALPTRRTTSRNENRSSSPELAVPAGLMGIINAALREERDRPQKHSEQRIHQINGETNPLDTEEDHIKPDHVDVDVQEQQDQDVIDTFRGDQNSSASVCEPEEAPQLDAVLERDHNMNSTETQSHPDVWDVPISPQQLRQSGLVNSSRELSSQRRRTETRSSQRHPEPAQPPSQLAEAQAAEHSQSAFRGSFAPRPSSSIPDIEIESEQEIQQDAGGDDGLEDADRSYVDEENLSDIDSFEESFAHDVAKFRAQYPEGYEAGETYEGSPENDDITIHIDSSSLKEALELMACSAWAASRRGWYRKPFDIEDSETKPIQILLQLLAKLERLFLAAPRADQIKEQNLFLNEHSDLLSYYFSKIKLALKNIRRRVMKRGSGKQMNIDSEERDKMTNELISLAIPMLFHILASAWGLGGNNWHQTAFTISTIELLSRILGWIGLLYLPLLRGLKQHPLDTSKDESVYRTRTRQAKRDQREELDTILKELRRVIQASPDELEREERRRIQAIQDRQQSLMRQKEIQAKRKRDEEARMRAIEERQWRSLLSIRGIHIPLSESPIPSSGRGSLASQEPSQEESTQRRSSPEDNISDWSREEKTFLFKKIQESYPDLLDLDDVRWELDRTLEETETMTEELLALMLDAVHPEQTVEDRDAHIQEVMRMYRRTWGHEVL